jgi:ABC-type branched-subunit amino acid transport system permease subunit
MIFALSYNMLLGQSGMLSFGHAVYSGMGAFFAIHAINLAGSGALCRRAVAAGARRGHKLGHAGAGRQRDRQFRGLLVRAAPGLPLPGRPTALQALTCALPAAQGGLHR